MAKAHIITTNGTKITLEGTPEEVAELVERFEGTSASAVAETKSKVSRSKNKPTPTRLLSELIDSGFFKRPKELGAIKLALQQHGHFYPVTSLSPAVLRLVRKRELRRIKEGKRWCYVV